MIVDESNSVTGGGDEYDVARRYRGRRRQSRGVDDLEIMNLEVGCIENGPSLAHEFRRFDETSSEEVLDVP